MMARFDPTKFEENLMGQLISEFWKAVTLVKTYDEAKNFFKDLLTPQEMAMLTRRLQIAKMLVEGHSYQVINLVLKVSFSTIAKVARWLNYGGGGYKIIVERMIDLDKKQLEESGEIYDPFSMRSIKKRYAMYYWPGKALVKLEEKLSEMIDYQKKLSSIPKDGKQ